MKKLEQVQFEVEDSVLVELNDVNGASYYTSKYAKQVLNKFSGREKVNAVVMGVAYGGGVERIARIFLDQGHIYGYDTFGEIHPKHLAGEGEGAEAEASCMDYWYGLYGNEKLDIEYQKKILNDERLNNVTLLQGEVNSDSCNNIDKIHLAFLDMDILVSMQNGYEAVKDKIVKDGYLIMHDVTGNFERVFDWYWSDVVIGDKNKWRMEAFYPEVLTGILRRI